MKGKAKEIQITQEMIDAVFSDVKLRKKFPDPEKAKAMCEMRLTGTSYIHIGKRFKMSETPPLVYVNRVVRLYTMFIEGEQA